MGVVDAFHGLGTAGAATLRAVAPGISEALITTAAGLFVAVPAVVAYNQFTRADQDLCLGDRRFLPGVAELAGRDSGADAGAAARCWSGVAPGELSVGISVALKFGYSRFWRIEAWHLQRATGRHESSLAEINITPLVDVVLVLLVIFMITEPVLQSGIEVNVPKTRTVKQITEQRMVVTIDRDQQVFLNDQPVNIHDLPEKLHQAGVDPAHQSIYLRSDERVPFGAFASVMDAVKQAGITNVSIVTQPLETKGTAGSGGQ